VKAHSREVYGLSFNPHNPHLLATCSSDTTVALRDWRNLGDPLHVLEAHTDELQLVRQQGPRHLVNHVCICSRLFPEGPHRVARVT
jgi:WD40 repeat protein